MTTPLNRPESLPLNVKAIAAAVQKVQMDCTGRTIDKSEIKEFVRICKKALAICEKYDIEMHNIYLKFPGKTGGENSTNPYAATILEAHVKINTNKFGRRVPEKSLYIAAYRGEIDPRMEGKYRYATIRVSPIHGARLALVQADLLIPDGLYIYLKEKGF